MDKLFIDTNEFERHKFNFDKENLIIRVLLDNVKQGKYEYCNLSIIDNEITEHIRKLSDLDESRLIKDYAWVKDYIDDQYIHKNCYKNLLDYEDFKMTIKAKSFDVSSVNPEAVFSDYFAMKPPFEKKEKKKHEFPDAFISHFVNTLCNNNETVHFVTADKGLAASFDKNVKCYSSIEAFLEKINKISASKYKSMCNIVTKFIHDIEKTILKKIEISHVFLEEEEIYLDTIKLSKDFDLNIIDLNDDTCTISCTFRYIELHGTFTCLDYENSYIPNDDDYYIYSEYISAHKLVYENYSIPMKIFKKGGKTYFDYNNKYQLTISYDDIKLFADESFSPFDDYDGEDSWTQDGYMR